MVPMNVQDIVNEVINDVAVEANITEMQSLQCVRATLESLQRVTNRYGSIDLSIFGLSGVYTRKKPVLLKTHS